MSQHIVISHNSNYYLEILIVRKIAPNLLHFLTSIAI